MLGRDPRGSRGLKLYNLPYLLLRHPSRPARVAWIETRMEKREKEVVGSRPARVAWIETMMVRILGAVLRVATRAGRVD